MDRNAQNPIESMTASNGSKDPHSLDALFQRVSRSCLLAADKILNKETAPTAEAAEAVEKLVNSATAITLLDLRRKEQNRFYAAAHRGQSSLRRPEEN